MPPGFTITPRSSWGSDRAPRSLTWRPRRGINTVYLHWPAVPGNLRHTDDEDSACSIPDELLADLATLNEHLTNPSARVDSKAEERAFMRRIRDFHMDTREWSYFAYNHAVFASGRVYQGRGIDNVPAAQAPRNTDGLAICCMIGTNDRVTQAMRETLKAYVRWAERTCRRDLKVKGHRDVNATSCPGDRLHALTPSLSRL